MAGQTIQFDVTAHREQPGYRADTTTTKPITNTDYGQADEPSNNMIKQYGKVQINNNTNVNDATELTMPGTNKTNDQPPQHECMTCNKQSHDNNNSVAKPMLTVIRTSDAPTHPIA